MKWPETFYRMKLGENCPFCAQGRPDSTNDGTRFFHGEVSDAYLRRSNIQPGLSIVVWRGRHVAEPTELTEKESVAYWREVLRVGRAIEEFMKPVKMNYNILGNSVPHLHTHIVPRYEDDPRAGWPFPFPEEERPPIESTLYENQVRSLIAALPSL